MLGTHSCTWASFISCIRNDRRTDAEEYTHPLLMHRALGAPSFDATVAYTAAHATTQRSRELPQPDLHEAVAQEEAEAVRIEGGA